MAQRPQEALGPVFAQLGRRFEVGQRARDALEAGVDVALDRLAASIAQAVLLLPDHEARGLQRDLWSTGDGFDGLHC